MLHIKMEGMWEDDKFEGYVFIDNQKQAITTRYFTPDEIGYWKTEASLALKDAPMPKKETEDASKSE